MISQADIFRFGRPNRCRNCHNKICYVLAPFELKVVCLSILSHEAEILPLIYIMLNRRLLQLEYLESSAFGTDQEASQPSKRHFKGYILTFFECTNARRSLGFLFLDYWLLVDT